MRKSAEGGGYTASPQLTSQLNSSKGDGDPLPAKTLGFMNQAFGADFSTVRIHAGSQAAEMSQGIQAKAFTRGSDIYFNRGQYSPESSEGKRLLAHELTHTLQQNQAKANLVVQLQPQPSTSLQQEIQEARRIVTENEASWKVVVSNSKKFTEVARWIGQGDNVVQLLKNHTESAIKAKQQGQLLLSQQYIQLIDGDLLMLNYIAFHLLVHANFLHNKPNIKKVWDIINKHSFNGRDVAIANLQAYEQSLDRFFKEEPTTFSLIKTDIPVETIDSVGNLFEITPVTSASIPGTQIAFQQEVSRFKLWHQESKRRIEIVNEKLANISLTQMILLETSLILVSAGGSRRGSAPKFSAPRAASKPAPRPATPTPAPTPRPAAPAPGSKRRKSVSRKPRKKCQAHYSACLLTSLAGAPSGTRGHSRCQVCLDVCKRNGVWPERFSAVSGEIEWGAFHGFAINILPLGTKSDDKSRVPTFGRV